MIDLNEEVGSVWLHFMYLDAPLLGQNLPELGHYKPATLECILDGKSLDPQFNNSGLCCWLSKSELKLNDWRFS